MKQQTKKEGWKKELIELKIGHWTLENGIPIEVVGFIEKLLSAARAEAYEKGRIRCLEQHYGKELEEERQKAKKEEREKIWKIVKKWKIPYNSLLKVVAESLPKERNKTVIGYSNPDKETIEDVKRVNLIDEGFNQCLQDLKKLLEVEEK